MINQYHSSMRRGELANLGRNKRSWLFVFFVLAVSVWSVSATATAASKFCGTDAVRDYLSPLEGVSLSSRFPASGELGVGPSSLRLVTQGGQLVPLGSGRFSAHGFVYGEKLTARSLNWWVDSYLERIGKGGSVKVMRSKRQFIGKVANFNRTFGFATKSVSPGVYRLSVQIRNAAGKLLEKHEQAFRALPAISDLRLSKSFNTLAPGESGWIRIDNYGTVIAEFGANYRLWTATGEEVPVNPIFVNVGYYLPGGRASSCWGFTVPHDLTPGEYTIGSIASDNIRHRQLLTTSFVVG